VTFACILELGVNPPPETGWKRPKVKDSKADAAGDAGEWLGNKETDEWLYHNADHLYFHLESGSLWEQRDVAGPDALWPAHSYFRVDFRAMQALSMFAASLESNLTPMAFAAWARYTKKKHKNNLLDMARMEEETSVPKQVLPTKPLEQDSVQAQLEKEALDQEIIMHQIEKAQVRKAISLGRLEEATIKEDVTRGPQRGDEYGLVPFEDKPSNDQHLPLLPLPGVDSSDAEDTDAPVQKATRRRSSCLFCCRAKPNAASQQSKRTAKEAKEAAHRLATANAAARSILDDGSAGAHTTHHPHRASPRVESTDVHATQVRQKAATDSLHTKRLGHFLDDVRGNPNRLISHVERRRAHKITDSGHQMAYTVL
jgi:hypothetical protein